MSGQRLRPFANGKVAHLQMEGHPFANGKVAHLQTNGRSHCPNIGSLCLTPRGCHVALSNRRADQGVATWAASPNRVRSLEFAPTSRLQMRGSHGHEPPSGLAMPPREGALVRFFQTIFSCCHLLQHVSVDVILCENANSCLILRLCARIPVL